MKNLENKFKWLQRMYTQMESMGLANMICSFFFLMHQFIYSFEMLAKFIMLCCLHMFTLVEY